MRSKLFQYDILPFRHIEDTQYSILSKKMCTPKVMDRKFNIYIIYYIYIKNFFTIFYQ